MQSLITFLFVVSIVAFPLQLTIINRWFVVAAWFTLLSAFIFGMHGFAIEQSYAKFNEQAANGPLIGNLVVVQTIEAIGGLLLSIFLIRLHYNEPVKKIFRYFKYLPGIVIFPALFYLESYLYLNITGIGFKTLAIVMALIIPLVLYVLMLVYKKLISELDLRLELKFLLHIVQLLLAVIISINLFRLPVNQSPMEFPIIQLGIIVGIAVVLIITGIIVYNFKINRQNKKHIWTK